MDIVALTQGLSHYSLVPVLAVFVAMVVFTYWPGRKREMDHNARIPFQDER